jgi:hypothetical protein
MIMPSVLGVLQYYCNPTAESPGIIYPDESTAADGFLSYAGYDDARTCMEIVEVLTCIDAMSEMRL